MWICSSAYEPKLQAIVKQRFGERKLQTKILGGEYSVVLAGKSLYEIGKLGQDDLGSKDSSSLVGCHSRKRPLQTQNFHNSRREDSRLA